MLSVSLGSLHSLALTFFFSLPPTHTVLDVVAFSFLYYVLEGPRSPLTDSLNALPNLVAFIAHMKAELVKRGLTAPAKAE